MNLLMTLDRNYVPQLNVMLFSALHSDSAAHFDVYLLHDEGLSEADMVGTRVLLGQRGELHLIRVNEDGLADAPTSDRYPKAIYYRIFAAKYLPDTLERVLYLDPDIVVRQSLRELYEMRNRIRRRYSTTWTPTRGASCCRIRTSSAPCTASASYRWILSATT